ncbi:GDP-D-mannose dehydratase [Ignavibacterium album JCM 16511]|uniref:GDP-mannose 4,6-dehydratase n=1 Tax=Ignavibacterium album (strain DSM 19864 / JCM 16511 / NBRC 101810 / Mat9-16) TaxID=945713 RepID=I0AMG0_IGNAJ|nr:GDP-mannose 4,6-dehydratase [Ignavibacterium album]AFH50167.1 GDP-D-mannose dehydratase [Ignavibacterium album JCM 16511]
MKVAIITGITGQDGAYLSKFLLEKGYKVVGITRSINSSNLEGLDFLNILNEVELIEANVFDLSNIIRILEKYKPDEFYNLAAQSSVGLSFEQPIGTLEYNIISVANILEAIRIVGKGIKVYQSSSSEMFGNVPKYILPIEENFIIRPASPYAISKAAAHWISVNYREAYQIFVSSGILFNHESVLRRPNFVTKKIISGAIKIKAGKLDKLKLGNIAIKRDWGYAPNYVEAMWKMLNVKKPDDYIISTGEAHSLEEFVDKTFKYLNLDHNKFVITDTKLLRPVDLEIIYGNPTKAKTELGWNYQMSFDELITRLIEDEYRYLSWRKNKND